MGLSGKVLYLRKKCYFNPTAGSVEAPLPSGYYSHHEGQAIRRGSGLPPARSYGVASAPGQRAGSILSLWVLLPEPTKSRLIYSLLGYI